jgi:DNA-binding transcriptional ArsR family regulator
MDLTPGRPDALLALMDTLGDPTRLRLLRLLERHELGVAELCAGRAAPVQRESALVRADRGWLRAARENEPADVRRTRRRLSANVRRRAIRRRLADAQQDQPGYAPGARRHPAARRLLAQRRWTAARRV